MISTRQRIVLFLSLTNACSTHDMSQFRTNFKPGQKWFEALECIVDLGYLGFDKDFPGCEVHIPKRKLPRRGKNLHKTDEELFPQAFKEHNKRVSQLRVWVEHAIGGIKRFYCMTQRWRNRIPAFQDQAILIASGIWNLHLGANIL